MSSSDLMDQILAMGSQGQSPALKLSEGASSSPQLKSFRALDANEESSSAPPLSMAPAKQVEQIPSSRRGPPPQRPPNHATSSDDFGPPIPGYTNLGVSPSAPPFGQQQEMSFDRMMGAAAEAARTLGDFSTGMGAPMFSPDMSSSPFSMAGTMSPEASESAKLTAYYTAVGSTFMVVVHAFITMLLVPCTLLRSTTYVPKAQFTGQGSNSKAAKNMKIQMAFIARSCFIDAIGLSVAIVLLDLATKFVIGVSYVLLDLPLTIISMVAFLLAVAGLLPSKLLTGAAFVAILIDTMVLWPLNQAIPFLTVALFMRLCTLTVYCFALVVCGALADHAMLNDVHPLTHKDYTRLDDLVDHDVFSNHMSLILNVQLGMASGNDDEQQQRIDDTKRKVNKKKSPTRREATARLFLLVVGSIARMRAYDSASSRSVLAYADSIELHSVRNAISSALTMVTAESGLSFPCWYKNLSSPEDEETVRKRYIAWKTALPSPPLQTHDDEDDVPMDADKISSSSSSTGKKQRSRKSTKP